MPLHPLEKDYLQTLNEDREAIILADKLGFTEAFVGEHISDKSEAITSSLVFLASLIKDTKTIKLGTGTLNLPNNHPAALAAQVAMIDHLLEGRFILGISPGGLRSDAEIFGNLEKDRKAMFRESISQMLEIWSGTAPYQIEGEFWNISTATTINRETGQGIIIGPYQKPHPEICVTAMSPSSESVSEAASNGWSVISANFLQPIGVASHWSKLQEGWARANLPDSPENWKVAKSIFVAEDEKTAARYTKDLSGAYGYYYRNIMKKLLANGRPDLFKLNNEMPDSEITLELLLDTLVFAGTPVQVAEKILQFRDSVGPFGTLVYAGHDWVDSFLARQSMELMATEVMPLVNNEITIVDHI